MHEARGWATAHFGTRSRPRNEVVTGWAILRAGQARSRACARAAARMTWSRARVTRFLGPGRDIEFGVTTWLRLGLVSPGSHVATWVTAEGCRDLELVS